MGLIRPIRLIGGLVGGVLGIEVGPAGEPRGRSGGCGSNRRGGIKGTEEGDLFHCFEGGGGKVGSGQDRAGRCGEVGDGGHQESGEVGGAVALLREEPCGGERVGCGGVEGLCLIVQRKGVFVLLVHIGADEVAVCQPDVLHVDELVFCCLPAVAFLVVNHDTNRPAYDKGVEAVEVGVAADLHSGLEASERGTVVGEHVATGDIVGVVLEQSVDFGTDKSDVGEDTRCVWRYGCSVGAVVGLKAVGLADIGDAGIADSQTELHRAREAVVGVEIVVPTMVSDQVFAIDGSTEPLVGVVVAVTDLDMVDLGFATDGTEGDTVDFLVGLERIACKLDTYIGEDTRVVLVVVAAVLGAGATLYLLLGLVVVGASAEDKSAPVARTALSARHLGSEDDRRVGCTLGEEFATTLDDERGFGVFVALDDGAGFDSQFGPVSDIDPPFEQVGTAAQGLLAREDKLVVAVADDVAIIEEVVVSDESTVFVRVVGGVGGGVVFFAAHESGCEKSGAEHHGF